MFVSRTAAWQRRTRCVNPFRLLGEPKFFEFLLPRFPLESGQSGPGQRSTVGAGEKGRAGERQCWLRSPILMIAIRSRSTMILVIAITITIMIVKFHCCDHDHDQRSWSQWSRSISVIAITEIAIMRLRAYVLLILMIYLMIFKGIVGLRIYSEFNLFRNLKKNSFSKRGHVRKLCLINDFSLAWKSVHQYWIIAQLRPMMVILCCTLRTCVRFLGVLRYPLFQ